MAERFDRTQLLRIEDGIAEIVCRAVQLMAARRQAVLRTGPATIDLDGTDVECYGSGKQGIAYNYKGVRHEAPVIRVGVKGPYRRVVAAAW